MTAIYEVESLLSSVHTGTIETLYDRLMLSQYKNSPNLKTYMFCFLQEFEDLAVEIQKVYYGRLLEYATGAQLDILGDIIDQSRSLLLPISPFGFQGAPSVKGFSHQDTPTEGGVFRDETAIGGPTVSHPLDDATYRRLLLAKGHILNSDTCDINTAYSAFSTILGRIPTRFEITQTDWSVTLELPLAEVGDTESALCQYIAKWVVPVGVTFAVNRT